jgi:hypothetical protein
VRGAIHPINLKFFALYEPFYCGKGLIESNYCKHTKKISAA